MKKITIAYWHSTINELPFEHGVEYEYSETLRNEIINTILDADCSVMLRKSSDGETLVIWISKNKFGQR